DLLPLRAEELAGVEVVPDDVGLAERFLGVETGAERALPRAPDDDRVDPIVVLHGAPDVGDLLAHPPVERVQALGPVERQRRDVVVGCDVVEDRLVRRHASASTPSRSSALSRMTLRTSASEKSCSSLTKSTGRARPSPCGQSEPNSTRSTPIRSASLRM